ncbi:hypothetical protein PP176A_1642 [Sporanaerobacter sp. PP17-6a]|jgi:hypothetical protein|nr:hypothetical protein PP176A_1642 [Sporanaerobacter sp. PP17-6a]
MYCGEKVRLREYHDEIIMGILREDYGKIINKK